MSLSMIPSRQRLLHFTNFCHEFLPLFHQYLSIPSFSQSPPLLQQHRDLSQFYNDRCIIGKLIWTKKKKKSSRTDKTFLTAEHTREDNNLHRYTTVYRIILKNTKLKMKTKQYCVFKLVLCFSYSSEGLSSTPGTQKSTT